jgi:hypothetical protein
MLLFSARELRTANAATGPGSLGSVFFFLFFFPPRDNPSKRARQLAASFAVGGKKRGKRGNDNFGILRFGIPRRGKPAVKVAIVHAHRAHHYIRQSVERRNLARVPAAIIY